jgi:ssDNA-binding replication factor A large subunit
LWNEDIEKIKAGDKVHLVNGYVSEWQGEMQLTTGRIGKLEIVGKAEAGDSVIRTNIPLEQYDNDSEEDISVEEEDIEDVDDNKEI